MNFQSSLKVCLVESVGEISRRRCTEWIETFLLSTQQTSDGLQNDMDEVQKRSAGLRGLVSRDFQDASPRLEGNDYKDCKILNWPAEASWSKA